MECFYRYGGSARHKYLPHTTFFLRRKCFKCHQCRSVISVWEYENWKEMHKEKDRLLKLFMAKGHE